MRVQYIKIREHRSNAHGYRCPADLAGLSSSELKAQGSEVETRLEPDLIVPLHCVHCLAQCSRMHEQLTRRVRDLPMVGHPVRLEVVLSRLTCLSCG